MTTVTKPPSLGDDCQHQIKSPPDPETGKIYCHQCGLDIPTEPVSVGERQKKDDCLLDLRDHANPEIQETEIGPLPQASREPYSSGNELQARQVIIHKHGPPRQFRVADIIVRYKERLEAKLAELRQEEQAINERLLAINAVTCAWPGCQEMPAGRSPFCPKHGEEHEKQMATQRQRRRRARLKIQKIVTPVTESHV